MEKVGGKKEKNARNGKNEISLYFFLNNPNRQPLMHSKHSGFLVISIEFGLCCV